MHKQTDAHMYKHTLSSHAYTCTHTHLYKWSLCGCRHPKNSHDSPNSCVPCRHVRCSRNPISGATPVPGPHMMVGVVRSNGKWNGFNPLEKMMIKSRPRRCSLVASWPKTPKIQSGPRALLVLMKLNGVSEEICTVGTLQLLNLFCPLCHGSVAIHMRAIKLWSDINCVSFSNKAIYIC